MLSKKIDDNVQNMNWHAEKDDSSALEFRQEDAINVCFSSTNLQQVRN